MKTVLWNPADKAMFVSDGGNWWEEWDDPEQPRKKRKAQEMEQQYGEAHTIWRLQLQDLSAQASIGACRHDVFLTA